MKNILFNIELFSKNKNSLIKFYRFFQQELKINATAAIGIKHLAKQTKTKKITILKSPHVNKTAQEHFKYRIFCNHFKLTSSKTFKLYTILKRVKNELFPDVWFRMSHSIKIFNKNTIIDPNLFNLNIKTLVMPIKKKQLHKSSSIHLLFRSDKKKLLKKTVAYLMLFDCHGELFLNITQA